jgi:hypothetical protein
MFLDNTRSQLTYTDLFALVYHTPIQAVSAARNAQI